MVEKVTAGAEALGKIEMTGSLLTICIVVEKVASGATGALGKLDDQLTFR